MRSEPTSCQSGFTSACCSSRKTETECIASLMRSAVSRTWPHKPAPCDVVTCPTSSARSINSMSVLPAFASAYATPQPMAPPPMMMISELGRLFMSSWLPFSRLTPHESRFTPHESRFTHHESRFTHHARRITLFKYHLTKLSTLYSLNVEYGPGA